MQEANLVISRSDSPSMETMSTVVAESIPTAADTPAPRRQRGFTLLELIVVISVVGILAAIAIPNLINTPRRAREAVLKTNLHTLRQVIDQHYGDKGFYPPSLDALADEGYVRDVPIDPMTGDSEWGLVFDQEQAGDGLDAVESDLLDGGAEAGVIDVYSLSPDSSLDGEAYADW